MTTNFPTSLDAFTNPSATDAMDSVTVPHATQHADLNDAVEALQAKVGVDGSAVTTSLDYKVANQGLTFVKSVTIGSGVSSVTVTNAFSATFDNYKIVISGLSTSSVASGRFAFGTSATSSAYYGSFSWDRYTGTNGIARSNNSGFLYFAETATASNTNAFLEIANPYNTNYSIMSTIGYGGGYYFNGAGEHGSTTSHTAFTVSPTTGTLTGGTIRVYGYNNG